MAITVKKIERGEKLTLWERSYIPEMIRGMWITTRHFAENLYSLTAESVMGKGRSRRTIMTIYYPEEMPVVPVAYRGRPVLVQGADGNEKCVACGLCEVACPPSCISITGGEKKNGDKYPEKYILDGSRCIFCGRCEEVCPKEAIVMSGEWNGICAYDRAEMIYQKEWLLRTEEQVAERLEYIRSNAFSKNRYE